MSEIVYRQLLRTVLDGEDLTQDQAYAAFGQIMDGRWSEAQIAGLLVALAGKGESVGEIAGAARAMRDHVVPVDTGGLDVIDIVGTGGTGLRTFNISTTTCLVCAAAGLKVAKHGNRTNTRASGSADVLGALGVNLDAPVDVLAGCLAEVGMCFCFAIKHHPAMKYAVPVRKQLGVRTIFNVLGPLTNPAGATRQVLGLFDADWTERIAHVLAELGVVRAMVVHADDGLDEISVTSDTKVSDLQDGQVTTRTIRPEDYGLRRATFDELLVDSPETSAETIRGILDGQPGAPRDIVVLNAAAALTVAGRADDIGAGVPIAQEAIDSGAARGVLEALIRVSQG